MKKFIIITKIIFTVLFFAYSLGIGYLFFFSSKEKQFDFAANRQGIYISQTVFDIPISQNPDYSDAYFEKSIPFNKRGDYATGFELLNKAIELDPKLHLGYRGWMKLRKLRAFDDALTDFDKLDDLTPNFVDAPWGEDIDFLRGECYFGKRNYTKAIACFNKTIKNQGEDWVDIQAFVYLGICHYQLGNYNEAITELNKALQQSENTCEAHFYLAKIYYQLEDLEKAKEHIIQAEKNITYKNDDIYNELLNEVYEFEIVALKQELHEKEKHLRKN